MISPRKISANRVNARFSTGPRTRAGKAAVFIDHNVFHVYNVADRVVVLDRGRVAGEFLTKDITLNELTEKMYRVAETGHLD